MKTAKNYYKALRKKEALRNKKFRAFKKMNRGYDKNKKEVYGYAFRLETSARALKDGALLEGLAGRYGALHGEIIKKYSGVERDLNLSILSGAFSRAANERLFACVESSLRAYRGAVKRGEIKNVLMQPALGALTDPRRRIDYGRLNKNFTGMAKKAAEYSVKFGPAFHSAPDVLFFNEYVSPPGGKAEDVGYHNLKNLYLLCVKKNAVVDPFGKQERKQNAAARFARLIRTAAARIRRAFADRAPRSVNGRDPVKLFTKKNFDFEGVLCDGYDESYLLKNIARMPANELRIKSELVDRAPNGARNEGIRKNYLTNEKARRAGIDYGAEQKRGGDRVNEYEDGDNVRRASGSHAPILSSYMALPVATAGILLLLGGSCSMIVPAAAKPRYPHAPFGGLANANDNIGGSGYAMGVLTGGGSGYAMGVLTGGGLGEKIVIPFINQENQNQSISKKDGCPEYQSGSNDDDSDPTQDEPNQEDYSDNQSGLNDDDSDSTQDEPKTDSYPQNQFILNIIDNLLNRKSIDNNAASQNTPVFLLNQPQKMRPSDFSLDNNQRNQKSQPDKSDQTDNKKTPAVPNDSDSLLTEPQENNPSGSYEITKNNPKTGL